MAPAPTVHGFTGEPEAPKQAARQLLAKPSPTGKPLDLPKREESVDARPHLALNTTPAQATLSIEGLAITLTYLRRMADPAAAHMAGRALV